MVPAVPGSACRCSATEAGDGLHWLAQAPHLRRLNQDRGVIPVVVHECLRPLVDEPGVSRPRSRREGCSHASEFLVLLVLAFAASGCSLEFPTCQIIQLCDQPGLAVDATTRDIGSCSAGGKQIPLEYTLARNSYSIRMIAFQNDSAGLGLQGVDAAGNEVVLEAEHSMMDAKEMNIDYDASAKNYRFWVLPAWLDASVISFRVVNDQGRELGHERLPFEVLSTTRPNISWRHRGD